MWQEAKDELIASLQQRILEQHDCGSEDLERKIKSKKKELQAKKEEFLGLRKMLFLPVKCAVQLVLVMSNI